MQRIAAMGLTSWKKPMKQRSFSTLSFIWKVPAGKSDIQKLELLKELALYTIMIEPIISLPHGLVGYSVRLLIGRSRVRASLGQLFSLFVLYHLFFLTFSEFYSTWCFQILHIKWVLRIFI